MAIRDQTKETLVLQYFLLHDNEWSNTDSIVKWVNFGDSKASSKVLKEESIMEFSLSRDGAVKICTRLTPYYLAKQITTGYKSRKVILYQLPENEDGFMVIARRMADNPILFLNSKYARNGIAKNVIDKIQKSLSIDLDQWKGDVVWVLEHSPTAFYTAIDDSIASGPISKMPDPQERLSAFLSTLMSAVNVDWVSKSRSQLFYDQKDLKVVDPEYARIMHRLEHVRGH